MAAAYTAGALSLEAAINVVYHRSRLQELTRFHGGMAAIGLSAEEAGRFLHEEQFALEIAAINSRELVTIAGDKAELDRLLSYLKSKRSDVFARSLRVDYAFHTRQMDPFEDELRRSLETIKSHTSEVAMISTVTGKAVQAGELNGQYWWRNMREPVMFHAAVNAAIDQGINTFIELGAHPVLAGPVRSSMAARGSKGLVVASLDRDKRDEDSFTEALAELYVAGVQLNWVNVAPKGWKFIKLPRHPFERLSFWAESEESVSARFDGPAHPLLGFRLKTAAPRWQAHITAKSPRYLKDHRVDGTVVFPASGYVELCLAAARETLGEGVWEIEAISFHDALVLPGNDVVVIETSVDPGQGRVEILSRARNADGNWTRRASARVRAWSGHEPHLEAWRPQIEPPAHFEQARFYRELKNEGHDFGPAFQGVRALWREHGQALGLVRLPPEAGSQAEYLLHPAILDACFQVIRGFRDIHELTPGDRMLALPISIESIRFFRLPSETVFSRAIAVKESASHIVADISVISETGEIVAFIHGFCCQKVVGTAKDPAAPVEALLYQEDWIEQPPPELGPVLPFPDMLGQVWLILADKLGIAEGLARQIVARGGRPVLAYAGQEFRNIGNDVMEITPDAEALARALHDIAAQPSHAVHLWALDIRPDAVGAVGLIAAQRTGAEALIALIRIMTERTDQLKIQVVTSGAVPLELATACDTRQVLQASILGVVRTAANEFQNASLRLIDIDLVPAASEGLVSELIVGDAETEVALRGNKRYVSRIQPVSHEQLRRRRVPWTAERRTPAFQVTMSAPGVIDNLLLRELKPVGPGPGEALIEVHATGLNFRDVMAATGLLPAEAEAEPAWQRLGFECAGVVRAVGQGTDPQLVGKRVVAVSSGCFRSHIVINSALVFPIPEKFSFAEAAALPTAYVTAQYSLVTLGRIRRGDRILIHSATGGVGLAAVSIAQKYGAEIIATAGSTEKREYLRQKAVAHIFDSRSLSFADDILDITDGYGVDIVLNSLPGPYLEKGLSLLAPGGRFLEIGKRDIYADTAIGLRSFRKNISFFAIDLARLALERPDQLRDEIEVVLDDLDQGRLEMLPITEFPMAKIADAFRYMAKAKQIGKVIVSCDAPVDIETNRSANEIIRADGTYLVTGGLGGFGLAIAAWLVDKGARSLVLIGRSGPTLRGGCCRARKDASRRRRCARAGRRRCRSVAACGSAGAGEGAGEAAVGRHSCRRRDR